MLLMRLVTSQNGLEHVVRMKEHCLRNLSPCFHIHWQTQLKGERIALAPSLKVQSNMVGKSSGWSRSVNHQEAESVCSGVFSFYTARTHGHGEVLAPLHSGSFYPINQVKISFISVLREQCNLNYLPQACLEICPLVVLDPGKWTINSSHHRQ